MFIDNRQRKLFGITLAVGVIITLVVVVVVLVRNERDGGDATPDRTVLEAPLPDGFDPSIVLGSPDFAPEPVARAFVERFGSFSNQSGYGNIDDVLALSTEQLKPELRRIAEDARAEEDEAFYGVSTQVVGVATETAEGGRVTLRVGTQRVESIDSPANSSVKRQDILVDLVETERGWLVDGFTWQ